MPTPYISTGQLFNILKSLTTAISPATQSTAGLLSASDKVKLDCIGTTGVTSESDKSISYTIGAPVTFDDLLNDMAKSTCVYLRSRAVQNDTADYTFGLAYNPADGTYYDQEGTAYEEEVAQIYEKTFIQNVCQISEEILSTNIPPESDGGDYKWFTGSFNYFAVFTVLAHAFQADILANGADNLDVYYPEYRAAAVTFSIADTSASASTITYTATQSVNGLMSAADKTKLDNIPDTLDFAAKTHTHSASEVTGRLSDSQLPTSVLSSTTASAITAIPTTHRQVIATISASASFKFNGSAAFGAGREVHVIIKNSGSAAITVTLPNSGIYKTDNATLSIPASSYAEVNAISDGSVIYLRSAV